MSSARGITWDRLGGITWDRLADNTLTKKSLTYKHAIYLCFYGCGRVIVDDLGGCGPERLN